MPGNFLNTQPEAPLQQFNTDGSFQPMRDLSLATVGQANQFQNSYGGGQQPSIFGQQNQVASGMGTVAPLSNIMNNNVSGVNAYYQHKVQQEQDFAKTPLGKASPYINAGATIAQGVGSLANIYLGFQQLGMQKEQLSMAKDQWKEQKQELNHIKGVRSRLTAQYSR